MKNSRIWLLGRTVLIFFGILMPAGFIVAQRIELIPHPEELDRSYTGYTGIGIAYDDKLCMQYEWGFFRFQLATYDGHSIILIPNPDTVYGDFYGLPGAMTVYNNNLYLQYPNYTGNYQLLKYDGTSVSLIPNPDTVYSSYYTYKGVGGPFKEFNGNLFFPYTCADTDQYVAQLARFDDTTICLIPQDTSSRTRIADEAVVYKNELYWQFRQNMADFCFGKLTGDSTILIPNPSTMSDSLVTGTIGHSIIYKDNLYWEYWDASGQSRLSQYDGNKITLFENPDGGSLSILDRAIYKNELYFPYRNAQGISKLAKFDGQEISLLLDIVMPASREIFTGLIVYNNKLYFTILAGNGIYQLAEYDGKNFRLIPNPDTSYTVSSSGIYDHPFIYNSKLFCVYTNKNNIRQLAMFDGSRLSLIENPDSSTLSFEQAVFGFRHNIYNNSLYFAYRDQEDYFRLARLEDISARPEHEEISYFRIYPNPSTDQITIETSCPFDDYDVSLFTTTGKLVLSQHFTGKKVQINISGLSGGIYLIQVGSKYKVELKKITKM